MALETSGFAQSLRDAHASKMAQLDSLEAKLKSFDGDRGKFFTSHDSTGTGVPIKPSPWLFVHWCRGTTRTVQAGGREGKRKSKFQETYVHPLLSELAWSLCVLRHISCHFVCAVIDQLCKGKGELDKVSTRERGVCECVCLHCAAY